MLCPTPCIRLRQNSKFGYNIVLMQLWGANNYRIDVTYDRIVPDAEHNVVVVDLLETVVIYHALQTAKPDFVSTADLAASFDCQPRLCFTISQCILSGKR